MKILLTCLSLLLYVQTHAQCWQAIATGNRHKAAIRLDGTLWTWGNNQNGQLGNGTTTGKTEPVQIGTDTDWLKIFVGSFTTFAIKIDGTLWAWGNNANGCAGIGDILISTDPVQVGTDSDWEIVASGHDHTIALKTDGTLWAWGTNTYGELGIGTTGNSVKYPERVGTANDWAFVEAGVNFSAAIKTDRTLWLCGYNPFGNLGNGTTQDAATFAQPDTAASAWAAVALGEYHTLAVKTDGTLWGWGRNENGQLGNGACNDAFLPVQIGTDDDWRTISAGLNTTLALKTDNSLWAWSNKGTAQNKITHSSLPVKIGTDTNWKLIMAGGNDALALKPDSSLWSFGSGQYGITNSNSTNKAGKPVQVVCIALSTDDMDTKSHFIVYPNPVGEVLNLNADNGFLIERVVISDMSGKIVMQMKGAAKQIDTHHLQAGMYLLELLGSGNVFRARFIKK